MQYSQHCTSHTIRAAMMRSGRQIACPTGRERCASSCIASLVSTPLTSQADKSAAMQSYTATTLDRASHRKRSITRLNDVRVMQRRRLSNYTTTLVISIRSATEHQLNTFTRPSNCVLVIHVRPPACPGRTHHI